MKIADILPPYRTPLWSLAQQAGVTHVVTRLPVSNGKVSWDYMSLLHLKKGFEDFGLTLEVIEPDLDFQMHAMKLGGKGRETDIEDCKTLIKNMGALGIPILCYNFMACLNWVRTSVSTPTRGGALVTSYDHHLMKNAPLIESGTISKEALWDNLKYFLERILPVAEACKVKLALHPDDPPVSSIRGISRIITNLAAMEKVMDLYPSKYSGITFCQGTLAAAGENIPEAIRSFGTKYKDKIFFVHFRDIKGTAEKFSETFHDEGQTDMYKAIKSYQAVGFDGPIRVDHAPTMTGESNDSPGYGTLGRIFALGYLKGLLEAANSTD